MNSYTGYRIMIVLVPRTAEAENRKPMLYNAVGWQLRACINPSVGGSQHWRSAPRPVLLAD